MPIHFTSEDIDRFWSKVDKDGPNGCWLWKGNHGQFGYGQFRHTIEPYKYTTHNAHRAAWIIVTGQQLESHECVLHNCPAGDNPGCVNPAHMFIGTKSDNSHDRDRKGRRAPVLKGSAVKTSKLLETDIPEIRGLAASGVTHDEIAIRFGVCRQHISDIVSRQKWAHIP